jgi:flavodoxin
MKTAIIYYSYHHKNTEKIVERMAIPLNAKILKPEQVNLTELMEYDLIGFGSGIYFSKHHKSLLKLASSIPAMNGKKAFIFSTSGYGDSGMERQHKALKKILEEKGFNIVGEFSCYAFDTFFFLRLIGGINKGRPNEEDLKKAEDFAKALASRK